MSRDRLAEMETFVRVVDAGSFSAAARITGRLQPQISKTVKSLEERLRVRLVNRNTHRLTLTEAGSAFYDRCKIALAAIKDAEDDARGSNAALRGKLRINTSAVLGVHLVLPAVTAFQKLHQELQIDTVLDERPIDPVQEAIDVIVRFGERTDLTLVGRRAGFADVVLIASPEYLRACGKRLERPADLADHTLIGIVRRRGVLEIPLVDKAGREEMVRLVGPVAVNSGILIQAAALSGAGIGYIPRFLVAADLEAGRLRQVLPDYSSTSLEVRIYHPFGLTPPRRITAFTDFAIALWRRSGLLDAG